MAIAPQKLDSRWKHHDDGRGNAAKRAEDPTAGPWSKWKGSKTGRFVRFTEKYLRSPKKEHVWEPIKLMPWQKEFYEAFNAKQVSEAMLGLPRGAGKSTLIAAMAAFDLFDSDEQGAPSVPIVAVSLEQAKDAIYSQIVFSVEAEPELERRTLVYRGIGTERVEFPRINGKLYPKAADPKTLQGANPWPTGYIDEIGHVTPDTYNALKLGRKRPGAKILGVGTWGPDTGSPLYQTRKLVGEGNAPAGLLWCMYSGTPGASILDEENWHRCNPSLRYGLPAMEFMRADAAGTPEAAFRTFRLNEPDVVGHDSWLGTDAYSLWASLQDHYELVEKTEPTYVGVDVSMTRDCTAVVCGQLRPDGRLHAVAKVWTPSLDREVDLVEVSRYILDLSFKYDIRAVSYDPRFFEGEAARLEAQRIPVMKVPQTVEHMVPAISALRARIFQAGLSHEADEQFAAHVVNAVARPTEHSYTLSKSKSAPRGHIDAAIALSLMVDRYDHRKKNVGVYVGSLG